MEPILLLYDPQQQQTIDEKILPFFTSINLVPTPYAPDMAVFPAETRLMLYLGDVALTEIIAGLMGRNCTLSFLPHPDMKEAREGFGVAENLEEAIQHLLEGPKIVEADALLCNERLVFNKVIVGNGLSMMSGSVAKGFFSSAAEKFKRTLSDPSALVPREFTIVTEDKPPVRTAAIGIIGVLHGRSSLISRKLISRSFLNDGRMHVLILAPRSVVQLVRSYGKSLFETGTSRKLPSFIGHIKARYIRIESPEPINFSQDGNLLSAKSIELKVVENAFKIIPGQYLVSDGQTSEPTEMYRINKLPSGDEYLREIVAKPLSLIYHASTDEFKNLFMMLRESAKVSSPFLTLMVLSTMLATFGLFSNSSPVIIGAMILAPLMAPIISLSMGVLRQEKQLMMSSLKTIGLGLLLSYLAAILLTLVTPLHTLNNEIMARIRPNLLDLGVAIISGIAGAYAHAREEVAKTLAGVAIAVALVPPLAVSGIGIGWAEWQVFYGALLLFLTNLAGIVLAGSFTFMLLGFSPFHLARKGLLTSLLLVVMISIPLGIGFTDMVRERYIARTLDGYKVGEIVLKDVMVVPGNSPTLISLKLVTKGTVTNDELARIKKEIQSKLRQPVQLEILVSVRR
ncbi:TIGR00341 family protein [Pontibacter sp. CAU 1760]